MTPMTRRFLIAAACAAVAGPAAAAPVVGQPAPDFRAVDADGRTRALSEFRGRTVVLEWTNSGCPYVQKHYNSGNMQGLQRQAAKEGVVWLTVISSAPYTQGHMTGPQARAWKAKSGAASTAVLLDPQGTVGRAYDAKTTPHMYIVAPDGKLIYMGGIDSIPSSDEDDIARATPYVKVALTEAMGGKPVSNPSTKPYGCSVKY